MPDQVDDELIVRLFTVEHKSHAQIARLVNCSTKTVNRALRRSNVPKTVEIRPYTQEELDFAKLLLEDGAPYTEVARTLGRDDEHLARRFPGYGSPSPADSLAIARMFRDFERLLERRGLSDRSAIAQ